MDRLYVDLGQPGYVVSMDFKRSFLLRHLLFGTLDERDPWIEACAAWIRLW